MATASMGLTEFLAQSELSDLISVYLCSESCSDVTGKERNTWQDLGGQVGRAGLPACAFRGESSGAQNRSRWKVMVLGTKFESQRQQTYTHVHIPAFLFGSTCIYTPPETHSLTTIHHNIDLLIKSQCLHIG